MRQRAHIKIISKYLHSALKKGKLHQLNYFFNLSDKIFMANWIKCAYYEAGINDMPLNLEFVESINKKSTATTSNGNGNGHHD